jgi:hypothetical protein
MKLKSVFIPSLILLISAIGTFHTQTWHFTKKERVAMSECSLPERLGPIAAPYDNLENWQIPSIVTLNDVQRSYVSEVLSALVRIVGGVSSLESEERNTLGCGQFYWPKDPVEPVRVSKSYFGKDFRMAGIAARLDRKTESSSWVKAGLTVRPRNFPTGVYDMQLRSDVFKDFELKKVAKEERQNERIKQALVFYLEHKTIKHLTLKIVARDDVAQAVNPFPSSFHMIEIVRGELESSTEQTNHAARTPF